MTDRPHGLVWPLASAFVVLVAMLGYWPEAVAGAAGLTVLWWRIGQNEER